MELVRGIKDMQRLADEARRAGNTVGCVPTMGFLHEGHLSLMRYARERCDLLVISIYVNPTQFGPGEDLEAYPRDLESDMAKAKEVGVDVVFAPGDEEMYPRGYQTFVTVEKVTGHLCGLSRPGHFRGVTTVVAKLFCAIKPHLAVFGEKDFQQLAVIKRMVKDLNMDVEVVGRPIVREHDGLAMSSRNTYLTSDERGSALSLSRSLEVAREMAARGTGDASEIIGKVSAHISSQPHTGIDYVKIVNIDTMEDIANIERRALLALAVRVGKARLIDNAVLEVHK